MEMFYDLAPIFLLIFLIFDCIAIVVVSLAIYAEKMSEASFMEEKEEPPYLSVISIVGFLFYIVMKDKKMNNIAFGYTDDYDVQIKLEGKTVNIWTLKKGSEELKNSVYIDKDEN